MDLQLVLQYVAPALGGIVLLITLINIVKALVRGFKKSLGSLVAILAAAIVSGIITIFACSPSSALVVWAEGGIVDACASIEGVSDLIAVDAVGDSIYYYVSMLLSPFFFLICYFLLSIVFAIVMAIVVKHIPILNEPSKVLHRLGGAGIGLVCGLLVSILVLSPIVGTLGIVNDALHMEIDGNDPSESLGEMDLTVFEHTGFFLTYDMLSNRYFEGERAYARSEVKAMIDLIGSIGVLVGGIENMDEKQMDSIRGFVSSIDASPLIKNMVAGVFAEAADKWTRGEEFIGTSGFEEGGLVTPVINKMLEVFKTTDKDHIVADLTTMVDLFGVISKSGITNEPDFQSILTKLGDGALTDMLVVVNRNPRMSPVADEITMLSVRSLASTIGVPADEVERYDHLMDNVAAALNDSYGMDGDERFDTVRGKLDKEFDHYGVHIEGVALDHATKGIIEDLGDKSDVSGSDVEEFFIVYNVGAAEAKNNGSMSVGGVEMLGAKNNGLVVYADGSVSVNGVILKNYNASNLYTSGAFALADDGIDIGDAAALTDADHMVSTMLTLDMLLVKIKSYESCDDAEGEAAKVGEIFTEMSKAFDGMDMDNVKFSDIMSKMGGVFDLMKASEVFGNESAQLLLKMMLQSDAVYDSMGMTHAELNDFADKMNAYAENKDGGYVDATGAVSGTFDAIDKAADKNATRDEKTEASRNMIDSVTHENKEMISSMVTGNMVNDFGVDVNNTETVADSFKNLIYNMASYKDKAPSAEELDSEAHAVSKILSLATVGAGDGPMFDRDGVEGSVDSDSDSFIKTMVESEVVMETIGQTTDGKEQGSNPYGISYDTEEEREDVVESLEKYYVENADNGDAELEDKLYDLAIVMDVEIDLDQYK